MWRRSRLANSATPGPTAEYIDATRDVLRERGGLWFFDKSLRDRRGARDIVLCFILPRFTGEV